MFTLKAKLAISLLGPREFSGIEGADNRSDSTEALAFGIKEALITYLITLL